MSETPEIRYGRVLEGVHIAGYTFARMQTELLWLLEGTRWKELSTEFSDVNDFLRSIDLSAWKIEDRPKLVRAIKAAQPKASNRAIAKAVGVTHPTVEADLTGKDLPPAFPEGEKAAQAAASRKKRKQKDAERNAQRALNAELVEQQPIQADLASDTSHYATVVADPPWDWEDEGDHEQLGRGRHTYSPMSLEELLELPVGERAEENAHLYLWITNRSLPKGFALMERWGFRYITCLTWVKPSFGMGNYFRGSTEQVLFGVRGSLGLLRKDVGTHFTAHREGSHSTKPEAFYELVESCSPGPWLELFSRQVRNGWTTYGAEVEAA